MPRIYPKDDGRLWFGPGDYGLNPRDGHWYARPPVADKQLTGSLANHDVVEHEDGTITVKPSILITGHDAAGEVKWHGYLERGIWREC